MNVNGFNKRSEALVGKHRYRIVSTESNILSGKSSFFPVIQPCKSPQNQNSFNMRMSKRESSFRVSRFIKDKNHYTTKIKILKEKIKKIENIREKYNLSQNLDINLTKKDLTRLEQKAKVGFMHDLRLKSVKKIENWWKKCVIKKRLKESEELMEKSARKIQKAWKAFQIFTKRKEFLDLNHKAATQIQKTFRGYLVRKKYDLELKRRKMHKNFEYFAIKKEKLMRESALKIRKFWLAYKASTEKKRSEENSETNSVNTEAELPKIIVTNAEKVKKPLAVKTSGLKKHSTIESPLLPHGRIRSLTEANLGLEPIKEIRGK